MTVTALKAHVRNGRIVIDEPVDLPDGAKVSVYLDDAAADAMSPEQRAALERALERSLAQADAGDLIEADEVLAELQRPLESASRRRPDSRSGKKARVVGAAPRKRTAALRRRNGADEERQQYAAGGGRIIWHILMPKPRNHVHYRMNEAAREVEILLVWSAVAGATPDF